MTEPLRYLSDSWLRRADELLRDLPPVPGSVSVGVTVRSGPDGERSYRLVLGPDRVGVEPGTGDSGVRMSLDWDVAVAIAQGRISAQRAFLDGDIQLGGDSSLLLGYQHQLAGIDDGLSGLRADTHYL